MEKTIMQDIIHRLERIEEQTNGGLDKRLAVLETKSTERWDNHDKRANELRESILLKMGELSQQIVHVDDKLKQLPVIDNSKRIDENSRFREGASKALWIIFAALIGIGIKIIFMG